MENTHKPVAFLKVAYFNELKGFSAILCEKAADVTYTIFYVAKGNLRLDYGDIKMQLPSHNLAIIKCPLVGTHSYTTDSVSLWQMLFSKDFLQDAVLSVNHNLYRELEDKNFKNLTVKIVDFKILKNLFRMIYKYTSEERSGSSDDVSRICFNVLLHIINSSRLSPEQPQDFSGRPASQITHFLSLIRQHIHSEHSVKFYADSLCITPGHLARILKESGNRNPKLIIETALADAAKRLLEDNEITIYAIAERLNFSSASSFTNFFKRQTLQTPSEYRSGLSPERK